MDSSTLIAVASHSRIDCANIALEHRLDSIAASHFVALTKDKAPRSAFLQLTHEYEEAQTIVAKRRAQIAAAGTRHPAAIVA